MKMYCDFGGHVTLQYRENDDQIWHIPLKGGGFQIAIDTKIEFAKKYIKLITEDQPEIYQAVKRWQNLAKTLGASGGVQEVFNSICPLSEVRMSEHTKGATMEAPKAGLAVEPKVPKEPKAPKEKAVKVVANLTKKITLLVDKNPKRGKSAERFNIYKAGMTVQDFYAAGGLIADLNWDVNHKFIELVD